MSLTLVERKAWHNLGYAAGFKQRRQRDIFPSQEAADAYLEGYRVGKRERERQVA